VIDTSTSGDTTSDIEVIGENDGVDIVAGLVVAFLSVIAIIWLIPTETETVESDYDVSAAFFPYLAGWATLGLSFLLVLTRIRGIRRCLRNRTGRIVIFESIVWSIIAGGIYYGLTTIGFLWTMPLLIASAMVLSGNKTWWLIGLTSVAFPFLVHQLVWWVFTVNLP